MSLEKKNNLLQELNEDFSQDKSRGKNSIDGF